MSQSFSWPLFERLPLIGILRNFPVPQMEKMAACYEEAGLTTLEITLNSEGFEESIANLLKGFSGRLNIGAGTVCSVDDLDRALDCGAQFIVTPIVEESVIRKCVEKNVPVFPGAYTPSEVYRAWSLGAAMVKVFPAGQLGPNYIKELLAPLNTIKLLPTGGISLENMTDYMNAGARGLGVGSQLIPKQLVLDEDWERLTDHFSTFVRKFNETQ